MGVRGRVLGTEGRGVLAWVVPGSCFASQPGNAQFTWALHKGVFREGAPQDLFGKVVHG